MLLFGVLKPVLAIWTALSLADDIGLLFRFARVVTAGIPALVPGRKADPFQLCDLCDDVRRASQAPLRLVS